MKKFQYAPGLPGYGTQGADGDDGLLGMSIYFSEISGAQSSAIQTKIEANEILNGSGDKLPGYPTRKYQSGDVFIDPNGLVYEIDLELVNKFQATGERLNTSTIFVQGLDTSTDIPFTRYHNAYTTEKFLLDNVFAASGTADYTQSPGTADGIYGLPALNFAQIKYVDASVNGYLPYTIWNNTIDTGSPEKAIALVKEYDSNTWRWGNVDNGGVVRDVSLSLDFGDVYIGGTVTVANSGSAGMNLKFASASAFGDQVMGMEPASPTTPRSLTIVGQDNTSVYTGGALTVRGGNSTSGHGGALNLYGGAGTNAGDVNIDGGVGSTTPGNVTISGGENTYAGGIGGNVVITGGWGDSLDGGVYIGTSQTEEINIGTSGKFISLNGDITASGDITATAGNITASSGDITAGGQIKIADGTISDPAIIFNSDSDVGIYRPPVPTPSTEQIGFALGATNGRQAIIMQNGGDGAYIRPVDCGIIIQPTTTTSSGTGHKIELTGSYSNGGPGGEVIIKGGQGAGSNNGGDVTIAVGKKGGSSSSGSIILDASAGNESSGADIFIKYLKQTSFSGYRYLVWNPASEAVFAWGTTSDKKYKDIKGHIDNALVGVNSLNGYRFTWNNKSHEIFNVNDTSTVLYGLIAQEVEEYFPELIQYNSDGDTNWLSINYEQMSGVFVEAIKEQQIQIEDLKDIVSKQQEQINKLLELNNLK